MAVFSGFDLKLWRSSQGISAADLAERISCDTTTIYRYESGKLKPGPDVMFEICAELGDIDKWTDWMRTEYPASYGRIHPETPKLSFEGALMKMYAELKDVSDLQTNAMHDGADGKIDDPSLRENLKHECNEALAALQRLVNSI